MSGREAAARSSPAASLPSASPSSDGATVKITAIRTTLVDVPLKRPVVARIGAYDVMTHVLVDLDTDEGLTGQTYLVAFSQDWGRAAIALLHGLEGHVRGMDPRETTALLRKMWQVSSMAGRRGLAIFAL